MKPAQLTQKLTDAGCRCREKELLSEHTGFRTGGEAFFVLPQSTEALCRAAALLKEAGCPYYILGKGSNVLAPDEGYAGAVLSTAALQRIEFIAPHTLVCEAGVPLIELCRAALTHSLAGAEFAYGIPGSVGGAVFMNAGAYGGEIGGICRSVKVFDGVKVYDITAEEAGFSYRHSIFHDDRSLIILSAVFTLAPGDTAQIGELMKQHMDSRRAKQPLNFPSCGSTFKRPVGGYASALIDSCGLKGTRIGGAEVSTKHAGFIVNTGGATTSDILALIAHVSETVERETGFCLKPEVEVLSSWK